MKEVRGSVIFAAVLIVVCAVLGSMLRMDPKHRNWEIFTEMVYSKAYESFAQNPNLPQGQTQQALVSGVVQRGLMPLRFGKTPEEAQRAGRELSSPVFADAATADRRGSELYGIYCSSCHDLGGNGRGPVVMRGMIPPPSLMGARAKQIADGEIFHILTYGQGNMASHAAQMTREERWLAIRHVRNLQGVK